MTIDRDVRPEELAKSVRRDGFITIKRACGDIIITREDLDGPQQSDK